MKKFNLFILSLLALLLLAPSMTQASDLASRLEGRILLQVEANGEAWYLEPGTQKRHFLGRPDDAFQIMRSLGLGISEQDYYSFIGVAPARLAGKILLRVEANGEAYYVNPVDHKMHYLGRPVDAFNVMRHLGLGITNNDLENIRISDSLKEYKHNLGFSFMYPKEAKITTSFDTVNISEAKNPGEWKLIGYRNYNRDYLPDWLNKKLMYPQNKDCRQSKSNIIIKDAETILFDTQSMNDACEDAGYFTISPDKSIIIQWNLGHDPAFVDIIQNTFEFTGTTDEYKVQNTFSNSNGSYSFQYPANWKAAVNKYVNTNSLFGINATNESAPGGVEIMSYKGTLNEYINYMQQNVDVIYQNKEDISINGISGIRTEHTSSSSNGLSVLIKKGDLVYNIYINSKDANDIKSFDKLVASFKLTNQSRFNYIPFSGMKVIYLNQPGYGFIKGVALCSGVKGGPFLWASFDVDEGRVGYSENYLKVQ